MMSSFIRIASIKAMKEVTNFTLKKTMNTMTRKSNIIASPMIVHSSNLQICRFKSRKDRTKQKQQSSDSQTDGESSKDIFDLIPDRNTKTLNLQTTTMRLDAILKAGLGVSRNKIEVLFYESKIRLNGEKVTKKSVSINPGDEIDLIKDVSPTNPAFLVVARIEVVSAEGEEETIRVKLRRCKALTIENYEGRNSWKP